MLAASGAIHRIDPALDPDEQELRLIYGSNEVIAFLQNDLHGLPSFHGTETNPAQDLDALLAEFASGLPIEVSRQVKAFQRRAFDVLQGGVWYLRTSDLRIFGWFPCRDCFIAVYADTFENVKGKELYEGRRNQVIHFRNTLDLDEPKFIAGDDPHAVLSNCIISD
jgi:hypothetical protein